MNTTMTKNNTKYPEEYDKSPPEPKWSDDTNSYIIKVRRYDQKDVYLGTQFFTLIEDTETESHIISSMLLATEMSN